MFKKISIAYDHNVDKKYIDKIKEILLGQKIEFFEVENSDASNDYPILAKEAYKIFCDKKCDGIILLCGTGIGMNIVANKFKGVRSVLANSEADAYFSRVHENSNCIVFGAGYANELFEVKLCRRKMGRMLQTFLTTEFAGEDRHKRRIAEIADIEK